MIYMDFDFLIFTVACGIDKGNLIIQVNGIYNQIKVRQILKKKLYIAYAL